MSKLRMQTDKQHHIRNTPPTDMITHKRQDPKQQHANPQNTKHTLAAKPCDHLLKQEHPTEDTRNLNPKHEAQTTTLTFVERRSNI